VTPDVGVVGGTSVVPVVMGTPVVCVVCGTVTCDVGVAVVPGYPVGRNVEALEEVNIATSTMNSPRESEAKIIAIRYVRIG
jgi:hypothetical protein